MKPQEIYHVYNRGNNRQPIFLEPENYNYFLRKVQTYLVPNCDILAYSLMPNHFHFLVTPNYRSNKLYYAAVNKFKYPKYIKRKIKLTYFSWGLQQMLSTYAKGINKKFNRTGSLFQQNTKIKRTSNELVSMDYSLWCFVYIHNNPKLGGLVSSPEDYAFSSYRDYLFNRKQTLCNLDLGRHMLSLQDNAMFDLNRTQIPDEVMKKIL